MNSDRSRQGGGSRAPRRTSSGHSGSRRKGARPSRPRRPGGGPGFKVVERGEHNAATSTVLKESAVEVGPFRILIAVHRPRYRGRAVRAAALVGWEVVALLNKQDVVGQVARPPRPPDLVVLSGDFGRQRDYGIFRAIQSWRSQGMRLVGMVEDCQTAPAGYPDSSPEKLCDICISPPYKTAELRALFARLYEQMRGEPAPPPISALDPVESEEADEL